MASATLFLRRLRTDFPIVAAIFLVTLLSAIVFQALPVVGSEVAQSGLTRTLLDAPAVERNLAIQLTDLSVGPDQGNPLATVDELGGTYLRGFPASIRSLITSRNSSVETFDMLVGGGPKPPHLVLATRTDIEAHLRIVAGRAPASGSVLRGRPGLEIAVSRTTATLMRLKVGDRLPIARAPTGPIQIFLDRPVNVDVVVVGIFEPTDPAGEYWASDRRLMAPRVETTLEGDTLYGVALIGRGSLAQLTSLPQPITGYTMTWRYHVDPDRLHIDGVPSLLADLRRTTLELQRGGGSLNPGPSPFEGPRLATGLSQLVAAYTAAQAPAVALLTVVAGGVAVIGGALLLLLGVLTAERRRATILLLRTRGAAVPDLLLGATVEAAAVAALAAALAVLAVALALSPASGRFELIGPAAVAAVTIGCLVGPVMAAAFRRASEIGVRQTGRFDPRRVVIELTVIALAGVAVVLLQRRGLSGAAVGGAAPPAGPDPFLAGAPVLVSLAVGAALLRIYPVPLGALAAAASRGRRAIAVLALRRASRASTTAHLPLVVLLLSVSVASFCSVVGSTVDEGQMQFAWLTVGADYRVSAPEGQIFPANVDLAQVPGVQAQARAVVREASVGLGGSNLVTTHIVGLDAAAYERVVAGTPLAMTFPSALTAKATATGSERDPLPSVVSPLTLGGNVRVGDRLLIVLDQQTYTSVVVGVRDAFPGVGGSFVLIDRRLLLSVLGPTAPALTALYLRAPNVADLTLRRAAAAESSLASVTSREDEYQRVHGGPLVAATRLAFVAASALAALYTVLALVAVVLVTAPARDRDLVLLRTLGVSRRQAVWMTAAEQLPPALIAIGVGLGLGIAIAVVVLPGLGVDALMGPLLPARVAVAWASLLAIGLLFCLVALVATTLAAISAGGANLAASLRIGER
ncbi:MAG: hypothetical protein DLM71_08395 [Chloroflexi bacterium]|nr:MAG: hypothetical protein DLM71_08395 [Chloroflexota bacterium]